MNTSRLFLCRLLARGAAALLLLGLALSAAAQPAAGTGFVESARLDRASGQLSLSGWAAPEQPQVFTSQVIVVLGEREIYRGRMLRSERADVATGTGRSDWLWSGFSVAVALPTDMAAGAHALAVRARLGNGAEFPLELAPTAQTVDVPLRPSPDRWSRLALLAALAVPLLGLVVGMARRPRAQDGGATPADRTPWLLGGGLLLSFLLLVAGGWTGSSLGLVFDDRGVVAHDARPWAGSLRPVRSDEWEVITPLALSQASHQPPFPVVNTFLGAEGQNMLVIGMTGVPVWHVSALARPATWGFFLFDLQRALAWAWWFPFFACLGAVWALLQRLLALDWRLAAGLALTVAISPYSVVFSGWPAYAASFPAAGLLAADAALRSQRWRSALTAGALLGLAAAGFALVLYPGWQISLATLFVPVAIASLLGRRRELHFAAPHWGALALAVGVALAVLLPWWLDAREAVEAIRGTVYPGQRSAEAGGDVDRWFLVKGWMSPVTMYRDAALMHGASDAGSVVLFLPPLLAAVALRWWTLRRIDALSAVLVGFLVFALWFMFIGFGPALARWTLWGSTTTYRLDLVLGLAQVLLLAWLASPVRGQPAGARLAAARPLAIAIAAFSAWQVARGYALLPPSIAGILPPSWVLVSMAAMALGAWLLMRGRHAAFHGLYAAAMLSAALPFNPLGLAVSGVVPAPALAGVAAQLSGTPGRHGMAVIGERDWAMTLPAAGLPVVNSVFYTPQQALWKTLDPEGRQRVLTNRYQRLLLELGPLPAGPAHRIESPRLDEVRVTLDPMRFDFSLLGGRAVLANARDSALLRGNHTLESWQATPDWTLFKVLP